MHLNQLRGLGLLVGLLFDPRSQYGLKHLPRTGLEDGVAPVAATVVKSVGAAFSGLLESELNLEPCEVPPFLNARAPGSVWCPCLLEEKLVSTSGWPGWLPMIGLQHPLVLCPGSGISSSLMWPSWPHSKQSGTRGHPGASWTGTKSQWAEGGEKSENGILEQESPAGPRSLGLYQRKGGCPQPSKPGLWQGRETKA